MMPLIVVALIASVAFMLGRRRALALRNRPGGAALHSLPGYYGSHTAIWATIPGLVIAVAWIVFGPSMIEGLSLASFPAASRGVDDAQLALRMNDIRNVAEGRNVAGVVDEIVRAAAVRYQALQVQGRLLSTGLAGGVSIFGLIVGLRSVRPEFAARIRVESLLRTMLMLASSFAILVTIGIVFSLLFETLRFFSVVSPGEFLFGLHWSPQTALRADQVGSSGSFGAIPVFTGTLLITLIAMLVAGPVGLLSAIYLNFYASTRFRDVTKPLLEILAGVPTVVYGVFAALIVAPWIRHWGTASGLVVASESALAAGLVMGVMIIPFVSSLSDDAITAVPTSLRDGSFGLGATRSETIRFVIVPAALPGIMGGLLLAFSRAIGETMIVVMAAGMAARLTANPLEAVTTVTVQIVALLTGDQEFDSAKTLSAFALGLVLFAVTLVLNVIAMQTVKRYRNIYD